jgi:hypothetical protein
VEDGFLPEERSTENNTDNDRCNTKHEPAPSD